MKLQRITGGLAAAAILLGALAVPALADDHGHGRGEDHGRGFGYGVYQRGEDAHGCVNPAGRVRGWCRSEGELAGYAIPYGGRAATLGGIVASIAGNIFSVLLNGGNRYQRLWLNSETLQQRHDLQGSVYARRAVMVDGYYDSAGRFHAVRIR